MQTRMDQAARFCWHAVIRSLYVGFWIVFPANEIQNSHLKEICPESRTANFTWKHV
jgi:hypothetical protein